MHLDPTPTLVNGIATLFLLLAGAWLLFDDLMSRAHYKRLLRQRLDEIHARRYGR